MGIIVPDLLLERIGITLPGAYVAVSKNSVSLTPVLSGVYKMETTVSTWTSHEARLAGKQPVDSKWISLMWQTTNGNTVGDGYNRLYEEIKMMYPNHVDVGDDLLLPGGGSDQQAAEPAAEPAATQGT